MIIEEQIELRRKRAVEEGFRVRKLGDKRIFGEYRVISPSGRTYRVIIRSFERGENHCSCPDYAANTLGTCKHIEAVLNRIRKKVPRKDRVAKEDKLCEVYLRYGETLDVRMRMPARPSESLERVRTRFFDADCVLLPSRFGEFPSLMSSLEQLDDKVVIHSDAIEYVDRQLELKEGMDEERDMLKMLSEGKLVLDVIDAKLYPYQMRGVLFAAMRGRTIIGDDMGLGKTVQAIAATELLSKRKGINRVLIVAPSSLKYQWQGEIRRFTGRAASVMEGLRNKRMLLYKADDFYKITNYEAVIRDVDLITAWKPDLIILDEAQRIKNWETKTSRAVKSLKSRYAIVLTGTPLENKLGELYSIVQFIDQRQLGPVFRFFNDHVRVDESGKLLGYAGLDKVREMLEPIFLRRHKSEVLKQLPQRTDNTFFVHMSDEQRNPYDEQSSIVSTLMHRWKKQKWLSDIDRRRLLCCITNMRMLCDSTFLFDKTTDFSPKLEEFREIIRETCLENGRKAVVFSQWTRMLEKAAEVLKDIGVGHVMFHGDVAVKKRGDLLDEFRKDEGCKVFLSTDAGGVGLNLQAADTVINLDIPWNPAVLEQRIGRVHRLGQCNPVTVINLVTRDSIEERVLGTLKLKTELFKGLFEGTAVDVDFSGLQKQSFMSIVDELMGDEATKPEVGRPEAGKAGDRGDSGLAPEAPVASIVEAGIGLIRAIAQSMNSGDGVSAQRSAKSRGREQPDAAEAIRQGILGMIQTDNETGRQVLSIPLPSEDAVRKGIDAICELVRGFGKS